MDRADILEGQEPRRLSKMTGSVLDPSDDTVLEAIIREVEEVLDVPVVLVSLVLERTQFFRAHLGLPESLATAQSTPRDVSFCQFVVRSDEGRCIEDAKGDPELPQWLVNTYNIRSYVGEPVQIDDVTVGTLCALDTRPRTYTPAQRSRLKELGRRVTERLDELAATEFVPDEELVRYASGPAFGKIRNMAGVMRASIPLARVLLAELVPSLRIAEEQDSPLAVEPMQTLTELTEVIDDLERAVNASWSVAEALQQMLSAQGRGTDVALAAHAATVLAGHVLTNVGGIQWCASSARVALPETVVISAIAAFLRAIARQRLTGLRGTFVSAPRTVTIRVSCDPPMTERFAEVEADLAVLLAGRSLVRVGSEEGALLLMLPRDVSVGAASGLEADLP